MRTTLQAVHPVLGARDVGELVRFYQSLGFALTYADAPDAPRYACVRRDGVELHIQWADAAQWAYPIDRPALRFVASDVDALYLEFVASGAVHAGSSQGSPWAVPADTPWGTREFHLRDPSQNSLQFYRALE